MKKYRKLLSLLLVVALTITTFSVITPTQAKKKAKAKVSSVKFKNAKKKLALKKGQTFKLKTTVKVSPNKAKNKKLKFKTSNKKVVTVSSKGVLKAKNNGTAKITATSKINKKKKAVVTVTVSDKAQNSTPDTPGAVQTSSAPSAAPSQTPGGSNQGGTSSLTPPATNSPAPTDQAGTTNKPIKPINTYTPEPMPTFSALPAFTTPPPSTPVPTLTPASEPPKTSNSPEDLTPPDFALVNAIQGATTSNTSANTSAKVDGTKAITSFTAAKQYEQANYKIATPFSLESIDSVEFTLTVTGTPDSVSFKLLDTNGQEIKTAAGGGVTQYNKATGTHKITLPEEVKSMTIGGFAIMTNTGIENTTQTATATLENLKFVKSSSATTKPNVTTMPNTSPSPKPVVTPKPELNTTILDCSFENGTDGWKLRWSNATTVQGGCTEEGKEDSSGYALKATRNAGYDGPYLDLNKHVEPGASYTFTCWVKLDETVSSSTKLVLTTSFGAGNVVQKFDTLSKWNKVTYSFTAPDDSDSSWLYFETQGEKDTFSPIYIDNAKLILTQRNEPIDNLPSLTEEYRELFPYFGVGAGKDSFLGTNGLKFIKSQFNSYSAGNAMKPDAIMTKDATNNHLTDAEAQTNGYFRPDNYATFEDNKINGVVAYPKLDFTTTDKLLKQAHDNDIKVRFHVLVWHQQTPSCFFKKNYDDTKNDLVSTEVMNSRLEFYVKTVMNHVLSSEYADVIYTFDVVNEYFHSHDAAKNDNTFWEAIYTKDADGSDIWNGKTMSSKPVYVKRAFKHAYDILVEKKRTDISLIYNDYNTYDGNITSKIVDMIHWLNTKDTINTAGNNICSGVGMQSHLDINNSFHSVENFSRALTAFKNGNFEIQITELDITNYEKDGKKSEEEFAQRYKDIMNAIIETKKSGANIQSVTLWSLYDGVSWRADGTPCIFTGLFAPKAAFYSLIEAAKEATN